MRARPGWSAGAHADVRATVEIELLQEATPERTAFEGRMCIVSPLICGEACALQDLRIDLSVRDEFGNDAYPQFFVKVVSLDNIGAIDGTQDLLPEGEAVIRWLIIPSPDSGGTDTEGKPYSVGAILSYVSNNNREATEVLPDAIGAMPQAALTLDYFLPYQVCGDDPFTTPVEPPVPYSLGLLVRNNASGIAQNLKIDTGQPKIVGNQQGPLVDFQIIGGEVNGALGAGGFLVDFGDIPGGECATARWLMASLLVEQ